MGTLFPLDAPAHTVPAIAGLSYFPNYISPEEEAQLIAAIDRQPWDTTWDRRRQPYGAAYGPATGAQPAIPEWGASLAQRMFRDGNSDRIFDQMLVNEYLPGQGIALHRDYQPFDRTVASLSLLAPCVMDFRHAGD